MQGDCSLHVTMLACCHEDEARLRDPWRVRVTRDSPSPALRRLCPLELVFWASAAQQMAALATLNTQHPPHGVAVSRSTPPVVSRTRAWASSNLTSDETFQSLKYLMIPADKDSLRVSECWAWAGVLPRVTEWWCWRRHARLFLTPGAPPPPRPAPPPLPGRRLQRLPTPELCDQRRRCEHRANSRVRTLDTWQIAECHRTSVCSQ